MVNSFLCRRSLPPFSVCRRPAAVDRSLESPGSSGWRPAPHVQRGTYRGTAAPHRALATIGSNAPAEGSCSYQGSDLFPPQRAQFRRIASGTGLSRAKVRKHVAAAQGEGIAQDGPTPGEERLSRLSGVRSGLLYRWEVIIRTVVVGFVSAGRLGREFTLRLSCFHYTDATLLIIWYLLLVAGGDLLSAFLRRAARAEKLYRGCSGNVRFPRPLRQAQE